MNVVIIKGRLVRDPELRKTPNDISVCNITVAVDRAYSGGERTSDFFDCVFWRQGAEFVNKYFSKGKEIIVRGEMQSRKWTDKEGNNRVSWEIQNAHAEFCGGKGDNAQVADTVLASDFAPLDDDLADLPF